MDHREQQLLIDAVLSPDKPEADLEKRIAAIEDKSAIRDLIMQYGYLCDARMWDQLLELYTDDIERELGGTLTEFVKGKKALREKLERPTLERKHLDAEAAAAAQFLENLELRHLMASEVIRLDSDGNSAQAVVQYALAVISDANGECRKGVHEGSYIFSFRKQKNGWKFSKQIIFSDNARNPMFQRQA